MYDPGQIAAILNREDLAAIVACTKENVRYLSDFDPVIRTLNPYNGVCWVVVLRDAVDVIHVVLPVGESDQILDSTVTVGECVPYGTFFREHTDGLALSHDEAELLRLIPGPVTGKTPSSAILELLSRLGLVSSRVAIDEDGIPMSLLAEVKSLAPNCTFIEGSELLREARRIKTSCEVAAIRAAVQSIEAGIAGCVALAHVGMSELELVHEFERSVVNTGARPGLSMLKIGRGSVMGQRRQLSTVKMASGSLLWFDCDVSRDGYWADVARVFALHDDSRFRSRFKALYEGQQDAIEHIHPGMTGQEVFDLTMSLVHKAGFPGYRRHHVGHGIGLEPYERPLLAPGSDDVVQAGMVICVETPYYEYGIGALHIEDPILVGPRCNTRLTQTSGDLHTILC